MSPPGPLRAATRVLVAEDSTTVRLLVRRILERSGFEVLEAVDGIEAITSCVIEQPDIALLDIDMPGCTGIEVLRRLHGDPRTASTQVLMLSATTWSSAVREALELGALDYLRKPCDPAELVARVRRAAGVAREAQELRQRSVTDELTGLPNRRGIRMILETLATPATPLLAVAVIDADHFKRVNDRFGHEAGDEVLRSLAARLESAWPGLQVGRWGGEEFLAVFPVRSEDDAVEVAERMRLAVAATPIAIPGGAPALAMTVSIGITVVPRGAPVELAIGVADLALYDAKELGRDRVMVGAGFAASA